MKYYRPNEQYLIENYELAKKDNFKGWHLHHRLELTLEGEPALTHKDLKRMGMYYNRLYFELIYLKAGDHSRLHLNNQPLKEETKSKISNTIKGKPKSIQMRTKLSNTLKGRKFTEEWKHNLSESCKGRNKGKPLSEINRLHKAQAQQEIGVKYREYKSNGGTMTYNEFRKSIKKR
jgi:hypothetical protein